MRLTRQHTLVILLLCIGFFLRMYKITEIPALNADEAALGYNAYSLLLTGKDEHGNSWPIHLQSFNDYKPALYAYLSMPFIAFGGLSVMSVRIVGVIISTFNILAIWQLVRILAPHRKITFSSHSISMADLAAFFLAVSPWHIHFSRGGWEVSVATSFITFGLYFFIKGIKNHVQNFVYSVLFFVLSLYTYHAARVIVPMIGIGLLIFYGKQLLKIENKKVFFASGLLLVSLCIPLIVDLASPAGAARASGVSIFADRGAIDRVNEKRGQHSSLTSPFARVLHNKPVEYSLEFSQNYLEHFWGEFLFLSGDDIQRNKVPEMGLLYIYQFPLLLIALYFCVKRKNDFNIIVWWLLIAPIPAALTFQSPHALRAQNMVIPLSILSAIGIYFLLRRIADNKSNIRRILFLFILVVVSIWSITKYLHMYYVHMAKTYPFSSQYGLQELVEFVSKYQQSKERIIVTDRYDQPYILFLFYQKYDPSAFQKDHTLLGRDKFGFSTVPRYANFEFRNIDWDEVRDTRNALIIGTDEEINREESNVIHTIRFPNGDIVFEIVEI